MRAQSMSPTCAIHLGRARRGALLCALTVLELAGVHGRTAQPRTIDQLMHRAAAQTAIDSGGDRLARRVASPLTWLHQPEEVYDESLLMLVSC